MRIAILSHGLSNGGAERVASILANNLAIYHKILFIAVYSQEREYTLLDDITYKYIGCNSSNRMVKLIKRNIQIKKVIESFQVDLVISFIINEALMLNISGIPLIYSLRTNPDNIFRKRLNRVLGLFSYRRARAIVFQAEGARNYFDDEIRRKGVVIGNPLTENLPYWKDYKHEKNIITACRLTKQKNIPLLINAFSEFHRLYPEYKLDIYGQGDEEEYLKVLVSKLKLENFVSFCGHSEEIHQVMASSGIFSLTSDFEGLSNSMIEALAIGIPTVCTDCPPKSAGEYIVNGESGFLFPVGDKKALVEIWCELVQNESLCRRISENEVNIRKKLNVQLVVRQWQDIIENRFKRN